MSLQLSIPDSIVQAIKLPEERICDELSIELAAMLYSQGLLSFGKARELAGMGKYEFGQRLGKEGILRHYGLNELEDDLTYACGK
jgi:predicted HTH domain antitoxin